MKIAPFVFKPVIFYFAMMDLISLKTKIHSKHGMYYVPTLAKLLETDFSDFMVCMYTHNDSGPYRKKKQQKVDRGWFNLQAL